MANTYTQCYFHIVFSPKNRNALIHKSWKDELEKYITGIVQANGHKMLAIYCRPDHVHIFIGYNVNQLIPKLVEQKKTSSDAWIKEKKFSRYSFGWQKGYGAFTHARGQLDTVVNYILNQEVHHKKTTFREEYLNFLKEYGIDYKEEFIFDFFDDLPE